MAKKRIKKTQVKKQANADESMESVTQKLPRDIFFEMRVNHLEMEGLKKDFNTMGLQIENLERQKVIAGLKRDDTRKAISILEAKHKEFMFEVKRKTGIDLKGKTINPETFEVL